MYICENFCTQGYVLDRTAQCIMHLQKLQILTHNLQFCQLAKLIPSLGFALKTPKAALVLQNSAAAANLAAAADSAMA